MIERKPGDKLRIGAVGLGRAFSLMLPTFRLHPHVELVAAADPRAEARKAFVADFGGRAYPTLEEMCTDPHVEAVYISTPHECHVQQACYAAARGKHLLIEKPMALSLADCRTITQAAQDEGVALVVGHSHSFDAPVARTRALIASGTFGPLRMIHALNYTDWLYRPRRPEELSDGGGAVFNQAPHQIDVVRLLGGGKVKSVRAQIGAWDERRAAPAAYTAFLTFESGIFASLTYSGFAHFDSDELMNWVGEGGQSRKLDSYGAARRTLACAGDEIALKSARLYGGREFNEPRAAATLKPQHPHFGFLIASCDRADLRPLSNGVMVYGDERAHLDEIAPPQVPRGEVLDEFHDAAVRGRPPLHGGAWTTATMEVCFAILESAREQREVFLKHQVGVN